MTRLGRVVLLLASASAGVFACKGFGAEADGSTTDGGTTEAATIDAAAPRARRIYVFGGRHPQTSVKAAFGATVGADGALGPWTAEPSLDVDRTAAASSTVGDTHFFLSGFAGDTTVDNGQRSLLVGLPASGNAWKDVARLPVGRTFAASATSGTSIYVGGGRAPDGAPVDRIDRYDSSSDVWSPSSPLPDALAGHSLAVVGDRIYVIGGEGLGLPDADRRSPKTYVASIASDGSLSGWSGTGALPAPTAFHASAVVDKWLFVIGGAGANATALGVNTVARGQIGDKGEVTWTAAAALPTPADQRGLAGACAVVVDRNIYVLGGRDDDTKDSLATVYAGRVDANGIVAWRAMPFLPVARSHAGCAVSPP
jgi:hypothetical protein